MGYHPGEPGKTYVEIQRNEADTYYQVELYKDGVYKTLEIAYTRWGAKRLARKLLKASDKKFGVTKIYKED